MKKLFVIIVLSLFTSTMNAQVPFILKGIKGVQKVTMAIPIVYAGISKAANINTEVVNVASSLVSDTTRKILMGNIIQIKDMTKDRLTPTTMLANEFQHCFEQTLPPHPNHNIVTLDDPWSLDEKHRTTTDTIDKN